MTQKFQVVSPDSRLIKTDYTKNIAEAFDLHPAMYDQKYGVTKLDIAKALQRETDLYADAAAPLLKHGDVIEERAKQEVIEGRAENFAEAYARVLSGYMDEERS